MPRHGPPGNPHDDPPGYRRRKQELEDLQEAAEAGSTQAKVRVGAARRALERQENVIRLRRKKRPT